MKTKLKLGFFILAAGFRVWGQHGPHEGLGRPQAVRPQRPARAVKAPKQSVAIQSVNNEPGQRVEELSKMTPIARRQVLSGLPAEEQRQVEKRLENLGQMPSAERSRLLNRYRRFEQLSPVQQDQIRSSIKQIHELSGDRRAAVKNEIQRINGLPESERQNRLSSDEFRSRFNGTEREIIESAATLGPNPS